LTEVKGVYCCSTAPVGMRSKHGYTVFPVRSSHRSQPTKGCITYGYVAAHVPNIF